MPNLYRIYFSRDSTVLPLPVNPEKLPQSKANANSEYNVMGLGPVIVPRTPKGRELSFSGLFPGRRYSGMTAAVFFPPAVYIRFFQSAMDEKAPIVYTPVRYYENGEPFMGGDLGFECLVTAFKSEERGGETGDFYYELTLNEYRDYSPLTAIVQQNGNTGTFQPASRTVLNAAQTGSALALAGAAAQTAAAAVRVALSKPRSTPRGQLYAGAACTANGICFHDKKGSETAQRLYGKRVVVRRIEENTNACPILVMDSDSKLLGWMRANDLQVVSG